ncbi:MAG TPA: hypothetical protein VEH86_07090 [Candidatus Acidoferrum sp.]|nr:hypothetical protein [Candidatus Acidoferrum sp.]
MNPYFVENLAEQLLRHAFTISFFISTLIVLIMGAMYFQKSKRLPSQRKAIAIQLITAVIPAVFLVVDLILAALDGVNITTIMNSINVFEGMIWIYIALLIIQCGVGIRVTRKLPKKLREEKPETQISRSLSS